jgi:Fe-Mn family superoxide dismutase
MAGGLRWTAGRLRSGEGVAPIGLGADRQPRDLVSARALDMHYDLYMGYVEALNRAAAGDPAETHGCPRTPSFLVGAVVLHEAYFTGVTDRPTAPAGPLADAVAARWGSLGAWWRDIAAAGMCARGWAVLGAARDGSLVPVVLDSHDVGPDPGWEPICAVDTYEHAYWRDFGGDRGAYLERLYDCLDWPEMERRYAEALRP